MIHANKNGYSLIELLLATSVLSIMMISVMQLSLSYKKAAINVDASINAQKLISRIRADLYMQFKKRDWSNASVLALNNVSPSPFKTSSANPCFNAFQIRQLATVNPDTYRTIQFQTQCQTSNFNNRLPTGTPPESYQTSDGNCSTPPQTLLISTNQTNGIPTSLENYAGDKIVGASICFRKATSNVGEGNKYSAEIAVIYRGADSKLEVLKNTSSLYLADTTEDIQIISN